MLYLVRHATAGDSTAWIGDDRVRPLDEHGSDQAAALVELLADRPITRILTSPYLRCVQSVEPLARARRVPLEYREELGDDARREQALELMRSLGSEPAALCLHGDLVRELLGEELEKGAVAVVDVSDAGVVIHERLDAPL
jgi:phosphohistidine phosphatase SixA